MTTDLAEIQHVIQQDLCAMDDLIKSLTKGKYDLIFKLSDHLISSGGKRLRPSLTLLTAKLCGYDGGRGHISMAAAIEFIHTATLLHDDVVDNSLLRRGMPTANQTWGNKASILVGDFLLSQAFKLMVETGSLRALDVLSTASALIAEGEVMQLVETNNVTINVEQYIDIISAKTAELFAAACQVGGIIAGAGHEVEMSLRAFGRNLGVAFQIIDDILDYSSNAKNFGKEIGDDFREGKMTLPVIIAYGRCNNEERSFFDRTIASLDQKDGDLDIVIEMIKRYCAYEDSIKYAMNYINMARASIVALPDNSHRKLLEKILDFTASRRY